MTIALHACCGPCLIEPLDNLSVLDDVVVVYANPNIAPYEEYEHRRDTLETYARSLNTHVFELEYDPKSWDAAVGRYDAGDPERCAACYRLRLGMTAKWAASNGVRTIATTLTVSPYQDHRRIREAGEEVASRAGLSYLDRDFRHLYPAATARARELGLYRQNYCGCLASKARADEDRACRRAERRAARSVAAREGRLSDG